MDRQAQTFSPVENHREREKGVIVYPVYSRRSKGLSVGINLFPDKKDCPFNCPYCEVFPFSSNAAFSLSRMEEDLCSAIESAEKQNIKVKDICFSGNGEPSLSIYFREALNLAYAIRDKKANNANLVLITNGAGLLKPDVFSLLKDAAAQPVKLDIWLKLDAGTPEWYKKINRSEISFDEITAKKKEFASCAPVTIQTMLCMVDGGAPPAEEEKAWEKLLLEMAASKNIRKVQIYGKARPAPQDPLSSALPDVYLEKRSASLRSAFEACGLCTPVEVYP